MVYIWFYATSSLVLSSSLFTSSMKTNLLAQNSQNFELFRVKATRHYDPLSLSNYYHLTLTITQHLLSLSTYCYSTLTITWLPLTCSTSIRICIYSAPTDFFLSFVLLIFLSVAFHRWSIHYVSTILANSCTSLHNHNSTFPLGTFVTSCWLTSSNILHQ